MAESGGESRVAEALRQASVELRALQRRFALVGGLAVAARAEPRFTRDVDLAVAVADDREAEALVAALQGRGYQIRALVEQEKVGRLATVRLGAPREGVQGIVLDLLLASSGIEPEIVEAAEELEIFAGLVVPVARTGHLIALKLLARDDRRRPQDRIDLGALVPVADGEEMARARDALSLIERRGFSRGRDLHLALDELLDELRDPA